MLPGRQFVSALRIDGGGHDLYTGGLSVTGIPLEQVRDSLLYLIALILSITVHEFGHAWMANRLGDRLPAAQDRLTLNPLRHIDPIGTIVFPLLAQAGMPVLGWGKPVQTNPTAYTRKVTMRGGHALVAMAGPAMNLVMAAAVSVLVIVLAKTVGLPGDMLGQLLGKLVALNLFLMFFNLLPIPPLDGGAVLAWLLPPSMGNILAFLERWGFLILLGLLMTGSLRFLMIPAAFVIDSWISGLLWILTR